MNKSLLRKLKPFLLSVTPQGIGHLIAAFDLLETAWKRSSIQFALMLRAFRLVIRDGLRKKGFSENRIFQEMSKLEFITVVWLEKLASLWATFFSPDFCCFQFLGATLDSNLVPERQDFTFEEIKQSLWDRYWPPQRQRCDFVAASAY